MGLPSTLLGLKPQNFSLKKFILFYPKKRRSEKISYIFSKESFCYILGKKKPKTFFIFQETELSYISRNPKKTF